MVTIRENWAGQVLKDPLLDLFPLFFIRFHPRCSAILPPTRVPVNTRVPFFSGARNANGSHIRQAFEWLFSGFCTTFPVLVLRKSINSINGWRVIDTAFYMIWNRNAHIRFTSFVDTFIWSLCVLIEHGLQHHSVSLSLLQKQEKWRISLFFP